MRGGDGVLPVEMLKVVPPPLGPQVGASAIILANAVLAGILSVLKDIRFLLGPECGID